jgi:hypothetical protein
MQAAAAVRLLLARVQVQPPVVQAAAEHQVDLVLLVLQEIQIKAAVAAAAVTLLEQARLLAETVDLESLYSAMQILLQ